MKLFSGRDDRDLKRLGLTRDDLGPADAQGRLRNANTVLAGKRAAAEQAAKAAAERDAKRGR